MDLEKLRSFIGEYKREFSKINKDEIYKWQSVKTFQENWDVLASDFHGMLEKSLSKTVNLLNSKNYFPILAILAYSKQKPEAIRKLFMNLFDEEVNLGDRISHFQENILKINKELEPDLKNYQDHHAITVYLSLRYPDRYYIYKFQLFAEFVGLIDYNYVVKRGNLENINHYNFLCGLVTNEIKKDQELLDMHRERITESEYFDNDYHILTQDFIHASVKYLNPQNDLIQKPVLQRLIKEEFAIIPRIEVPVLKGTILNHTENDKENKRIGDLGELLVLEFEQERLKNMNIMKNPIHMSKSKGDGLGYDILSYNEFEEKIYIEVKTTRKAINQPFYLTKNELECSKIVGNKYFIYRLYDFDDKENKAKYFVHVGDLSNICINPTQYRIIFD